MVVLTRALSVAGFAAASIFYSSASAGQGTPTAAVSTNALVRPHSPVIGPRKAPVTIVEFFDPSCEACRAVYPDVKQIMARYPKQVRLVVRYAPFHPGSEEAVRILEAARSQGVYVPVLEAVLAQQPQWHDGNMMSAWSAAAAAGLNVKRARATMLAPKVTAMMQQDVSDARALGVKGTPTFFVNGRPLTELGMQQLEQMVRAEAEAGRR
jgi:protein-disulfide isomerase